MTYLLRSLEATLEPDEHVRVTVKGREGTLSVTTRRAIVAEATGVVLAAPLDAIRRVELDIEQGRPATLVVVPEATDQVPALLSIAFDQYEAAGAALTMIGGAFARPKEGTR